MGNPKQRRNKRVTARLREHAFRDVDDDDGGVRRRRARHHVSCVLDVPRRIRDDEFPARRGEITIRDVDRDLLLALGAETIGHVREVRAILPAPPADSLDLLELIVEDRLRIVKQPADQRALAVVDAARRREPQQIHCGVRGDGRHQK